MLKTLGTKKNIVGTSYHYHHPGFVEQGGVVWHKTILIPTSAGSPIKWSGTTTKVLSLFCLGVYPWVDDGPVSNRRCEADQKPTSVCHDRQDHCRTSSRQSTAPHVVCLEGISRVCFIFKPAWNQLENWYAESPRIHRVLLE